jgi:hypothetical protein
MRNPLKQWPAALAAAAGFVLATGHWTPATAQQNQFPQSALLPRYQANFSKSLSSAASTVTVQATSTSDAVQFEEADVYCSVACTATIEVNGTAATSTTLAVTGPIGVAASSVLPTAWSASNVGSPTALKTFNLAAGATLVLDMHAFYFPAAAGSGTNLTIATSSITGTATIQIQWYGITGPE